MKSKVLNSILQSAACAASVLVCAMVCNTVFSTLLRLLGVLGHNRLRGDIPHSIFEQYLITFWYDLLDSREFGFLVTPIIWLIFMFLNRSFKLYRILSWVVVSIVAYQFMIPGGLPALLTRKHGGYWILIFNGLACGLLFPKVEQFLTYFFKTLNQTRLFEESK